MLSLHRTLKAVALCAALALTGQSALAADVVTKVEEYGTLSLPYSTNYGNTFTALSPLVAGDRFYDDYAFTIADGTFSSISATFDLGSVLGISNLQARLFRGDPWAGATPGTLTAGDLLQIWSNTVLTSSGSGSVQVINPYDLAAGKYVLEVRGNVTGTSGGSYAGVFNVAAVPEPAGLAFALAGLGGLILVKRRTKR